VLIIMIVFVPLLLVEAARHKVAAELLLPQKPLRPSCSVP
jgi:hypothetical protein